MVQNNNVDNAERLLLALSEDLKTPLISIAYSAESESQNGNQQTFSDISKLSRGAINLIDAYTHSLRIESGQQILNLEPIAAGAILTDSAHDLSELAKIHGCQLVVDVSPSQKPLMADRKSLATALTSLGQLFINSETGDQILPQNTIKLAAYRSKGGVAIGVFSSAVSSGLTTASLRSARSLYGKSYQPLPALSTASQSGLFVADSLFSAMSSSLRVARRGEALGIAGTFATSNQLALV